MKRTLSLIIISLLVILTINIYGQDQKLIDSLHNELRKFDANKIEMGSKATPLMDSAKANILYGLVVAYYGRTIPDSANLYAERLKSISEQIGYKKGIGNYYNGIGLINMVFGRNFPLAEESFRRALKIRTEIGDKEGIGWTYNNMGNMYGGEGNILESIKYHGKALQVFEESGNIDEVISSLTKRSAELINIGNYPEALNDALHALKLCNENGLKVSATVALDEIGGIYEREGNYGEALKNFTEAAKLLEESGDNNGLANSNQVFGNIYLLKGDTAEALRSYNKALKRYSFNPNGYFNLQNNFNIGNIYFYKSNYDEALKYYFDALKICEILKEKNGLSSVSIAIAKVYNKQGKYQEALRYVNIALEDGLQRGQKDEMKDSYKTLSEIFSNLHDYKAAYTNQILYQQMKDTLFNIGNTSKMKQLDMQYEFDKDVAIQKAVQDKKDVLVQKEAETQQFRRNAIFLISGIVVVFLIVVIILRNRIAKERRQKALELERNRISRDLHDDLGSGLTKIAMMSQNARKITGIDQQNALQKITNESSEMVEMMNVIIWAMNTTNDSLPNLLSYLKINAYELYENAAIKLTWKVPDIIPESLVYGETRRNIYLVVKEALHNVLKYSEATDVVVIVNIKDDELSISIDDDGNGFDVNSIIKKSYGGTGLLNMKKRMEEVIGTFNITSELNAGTKVSISCSLKHYTKV